MDGQSQDQNDMDPKHKHQDFDSNRFVQTNLVSDGFVPAQHIDSNLINPWGFSHGPSGPLWVSDNGTGVTTVYTGNGTLVPIGGHPAITIATPPGQTTPASPTGQVFNTSGHGFDITQNGTTASSVFIFATEDGTISGWNPTVNGGSSVIAVDNSAGGTGAVYKGLAIGHTHNGHERLYAANFRSGTVDVFNQQFHAVKSFTASRLHGPEPPGGIRTIQRAGSQRTSVRHLRTTERGKA